jgi:hypothetical protein
MMIQDDTMTMKEIYRGFNPIGEAIDQAKPPFPPLTRIYFSQMRIGNCGIRRYEFYR